jgi:pyruvate/2-oxoglutarate/acetoin dehydrogenase E1 component
VRRTGTDVTVITFGAMVHVALEAAETLENQGVEAEVIDLRTLAPLDRETVLTSVAKTNRAIVLHEASRTGGIGGEIAAIVGEEAFGSLDAPVRRLAALDVPVPFSPVLEKACLPTAEKLIAAVEALVEY